MIHQALGKFASEDICKLHALFALLLLALLAIQGVHSLFPKKSKSNFKDNSIQAKHKPWKIPSLFGKKKKRKKKRSKPDDNDNQIYNLWWKMKQMVFDTKRSINALRRLNPVRR